MTPPLHLFQAYGVELEYMLVRSDTLDVLPAADRVLAAAAGGEIVSDVENGPVAWSNELTLHVVELKTNGPAENLESLPELFQANVRQLDELARSVGGRLMPGAMHPWMDPDREMVLWPHDYSPVYQTFHRIFDCRGHGWANLQSVHLNLPFADDAEFGRLHAAVRLLLPILPALAASSPVMDGHATGPLDNRLHVYRTNARRIPSVSGRVIPERVFTRADYDREIFQVLFRDVAPLDPEGVLQDEFLNARGAIARFSRGAIEIRVLDVQECPQADVAICAAAVAVLKDLVSERWTSLAKQQTVEIEPLERVLLATIRDADRAAIDDVEYLAHFGVDQPMTAGELWRRLLEDHFHRDANFESAWAPALRTILDQGPLARRIVARLAGDMSREKLAIVYGELCDCLLSGRLFDPSLP